MDALFEFCLRMGDNTLVLGHRVSEWCGHAPVLEEDIALANTALDLIGQTQFWLGLAGEVERKGRDADALAFRRDAWDFRNVLLVEQPNGDFGQTILRQFLFDAWQSIMLERLKESSDERVKAIAQLYPYVGELFGADEVDREMAERGIAPLPADLRDAYDALLTEVMEEATLTIPDNRWAHSGGRDGSRHSEHLGHILAEMQWLQRAYPDARW